MKSIKGNLRLLVLASLTALCAHWGVSAEAVEIRRQGRRVIDGEKVDLNSRVARSTVKLVMSMKGGGAAVCTGSIIDTDTILTAAHCLAGAKSVVVQFGNDGAIKQTQVSANFKIHPKYKVQSGGGDGETDYNEFLRYDANMAGSLVQMANHYQHNLVRELKKQVPDLFVRDYDIALVQLSQAIPAGFVPVRVATAKAFKTLKYSTKLSVTGYGVHLRDADSVQPQNTMLLQTVNQFLGADIETATLMEMSLDTTGKQSACFGDSGGPVYALTNTGELLQVAVMKAVLKCMIGIHTTPSEYAGFIAETKAELRAQATQFAAAN